MLPTDLLTLSASTCYSVASTDLIRRSGALDVLHFSLLMHTCCVVSMSMSNPGSVCTLRSLVRSWVLIYRGQRFFSRYSDLSKSFECHDPKPQGIALARPRSPLSRPRQLGRPSKLEALISITYAELLRNSPTMPTVLVRARLVVRVSSRVILCNYNTFDNAHTLQNGLVPRH